MKVTIGHSHTEHADGIRADLEVHGSDLYRNLRPAFWILDDPIAVRQLKRHRRRSMQSSPT